MSLNVSMINDRILVKQIKQTKSAGGIHLPGKRQIEYGAGEIMAVGPGRMLDSGKRNEVLLNPGDIVYYIEALGSTVPVDIDNETYLMMHEESVICVLHDGISEPCDEIDETSNIIAIKDQ